MGVEPAKEKGERVLRVVLAEFVPSLALGACCCWGGAGATLLLLRPLLRLLPPLCETRSAAETAAQWIAASKAEMPLKDSS
jgi:hypothetical protein